MALEPAGYRWTCDWCGKSTVTASTMLPADWRAPDKGWLFIYEPEHLCSPACTESIRLADGLAHDLSHDLHEIIRKTYSKKDKIDKVPAYGDVKIEVVVHDVSLTRDRQGD